MQFLTDSPDPGAPTLVPRALRYAVSEIRGFAFEDYNAIKS